MTVKLRPVGPGLPSMPQPMRGSMKDNGKAPSSAVPVTSVRGKDFLAGRTDKVSNQPASRVGPNG